jgi:hypothetical protein
MYCYTECHYAECRCAECHSAIFRQSHTDFRVGFYVKDDFFNFTNSSFRQTASPQFFFSPKGKNETFLTKKKLFLA